MRQAGERCERRAAPHTHTGLWPLPEQLCACRSPVTLTQGAAAHVHVGDLADVPRIDILIERRAT